MAKPSLHAATQRRTARQINSQDVSGCNCRRHFVAHSLPVGSLLGHVLFRFFCFIYFSTTCNQMLGSIFGKNTHMNLLLQQLYACHLQHTHTPTHPQPKQTVKHSKRCFHFLAIFGTRDIRGHTHI